jgi:photosystem II stability/assembly factor-like uncharacterized protein
MRTGRTGIARLMVLSLLGAFCLALLVPLGVAGAATFEPWTPQTSGTTQSLYDAAFVNSKTGWAAGTGGTIRHTTNGGATWTAQTSGTTQTLYAIAFVDANKGWAVGARGTVLRTTNGGTTWAAQTSGTTQTLYAVAFLDANNGWAVGSRGTVRHTTNGGTTWSSQSVGGWQTLYDIAFRDANNGWLVSSSGTILHTTTSGASWSTQSSGTRQALYAITFATANDGWAVGSGGTIRHTTNAGSVWTGETSGTTQTLRSLARSSGGLWATGYGGTILTCLPDTAPPTTTATGLQTDDHTGWRNLSQSVTLTASDGKGSGVAATYYTVDGGGRQTYAGAFTVSGTGRHPVIYWSVDTAGNAETAHTGWVNIDMVAPTVGDNADALWHNGDVTVQVNAADLGGSGLAGTQYRPQGSTTWVAATGDAFTVPAPAGGGNDGAHVYEYRALDTVGNASLTGSCTVRIDTTPATCATTGLAPDRLTGWSTTDRQVTLSADDGAGSRVAAVHYTVDGGGQHTYAGAFTISGLGQHPVTYWSVDKAGNVEVTHTGWVNIAGLYAEATGLAPDADSGWRNNDAPVTITAGGGPAPLTVSYKLDGGDWQTAANGTSFTVSGVGHHAVAYHATNGIGETCAELTAYVNIETTAPVTERGAVPAGWRRTALTVTLQPTDADSGIASTLYRIDGGPEISATSVTIQAPADHSMDGVHTVAYHSVDKAGNVEATKSFVVRIDTRRPVTKAPYRASVLRYGYAKLRCRIADTKPCALYGSAQIVVKKLNGRVALRKSYTHVRTNALVTLKLRCKLARGTYRFFVLAKDAAGNAQSKTGVNKLTVR